MQRSGDYSSRILGGFHHTAHRLDQSHVGQRRPSMYDDALPTFTLRARHLLQPVLLLVWYSRGSLVDTGICDAIFLDW